MGPLPCQTLGHLPPGTPSRVLPPPPAGAPGGLHADAWVPAPFLWAPTPSASPPWPGRVHSSGASGEGHLEGGRGPATWRRPPPFRPLTLTWGGAGPGWACDRERPPRGPLCPTSVCGACRPGSEPWASPLVCRVCFPSLVSFSLCFLVEAVGGYHSTSSFFN